MSLNHVTFFISSLLLHLLPQQQQQRQQHLQLLPQRGNEFPVARIGQCAVCLPGWTARSPPFLSPSLPFYVREA